MFSRIIEYMEKATQKNGKIWVLRIVLTIACIFAFAWIFSNSLKTGEQSSAQSQAVTKAVQDTAKVVAPSSKVATATGEDYELLHNVIRSIAHFSEFAVLGALLAWCYLSYTRQKALFILPIGLIVLTPIVDETLQISTGGRGAEMKDILLDTAGGLLGTVCALAIVWLVFALCKRRRRKRGDRV